MSRAMVAIAAFVLAGGTYLLYAQSQTESPEAVYRECQRLRAKIEEADEQIRDVEYQLERVRKAAANYEYVREQNAALIGELDEWAEAE